MTSAMPIYSMSELQFVARVDGILHSSVGQAFQRA